jgi:type IV pilus assembly protein PilA
MHRSIVRSSRGFTLAETMTVVVIIGILAALAVYSVRKYVFAAKSAEARQMLLAIKAGEETYREETYLYRSASEAGFSDYASLYPHKCAGGAAPGKAKYSWEQASGCVDAAAWRELGVSSTNPVQYGYAAVAVAAGGNMPSDAKSVGSFNWGKAANPTGPAFAVVAHGDLNGDGTFSLFLGSSFTDEIYVENEDE